MSKYPAKSPAFDHIYQLEEFSSGRALRVWNALGAHPAVESGVLESECRAVLQSFFKNRRK